MANNCFTWLDNFKNQENATTLGHINGMFTDRHIGGIVFISILIFVGFLGNLIVFCIYGFKFKSTNYRTFILCLVVIDIANCSLGMPFLVVYLSHYLTFPSVDFCRIGRFVITLTTNGSAFILVVIAFDRYRKVCRPMEWQMSKFQAWFSCSVAICLATAVSSPTIILYGSYTEINALINVTGTRCWTDDNFKDGYYPSMYYIGLSILSFAISVILLVTYILILKCLYQHKKSGKLIHTRKTTITLLAVTLAFIFSAVPHYTLVILTRMRKNFQCQISFTEGFVFYTFVFSILINNSINPFIYGFSDANFSSEIREIIMRCCQRFCRSRNLEPSRRAIISSEYQDLSD